MKIELTSDEAYFLEKLCDQQQAMISGNSSKAAEMFFLIKTNNSKDNDLMCKALVKKFEEEARTTILLDSLRDKFERIRGNNK